MSEQTPRDIWSGVTEIDHGTQRLPDRLFRLAAEHARRAISSPTDTPLDVYDRTTSLGAAAELLLKATLAGVSVTLLAGNTNTSTLVRFSTARVKVYKETATSTVGASDAVTRLNDLLPKPSHTITTLKRGFPARNGAVHLGDELADTEFDSARAELVTLVSEVFAARRHLNQSADWDEFWSPKYAHIATAIREKTIEHLRDRFDTLVSNAADQYAQLVDNLEPEARHDVIQNLATRAENLDYLARGHQCPACKNYTLQALYETRREVDVDYSDAPHSPAYFVHEIAELDFATCPVCGLRLGRTNVGFTDIPLTLDRGETDATADEVQAWQDNEYEKNRALAEHADADLFDAHNDPFDSGWGEK